MFPQLTKEQQGTVVEEVLSFASSFARKHAQAAVASLAAVNQTA